jgi:Methyltransferase domain
LAVSVRDGYIQRRMMPSDIMEYLPLLYAYARLYVGARILEIGSRTGNSTLAFLFAAQETGGHVWSVDIDPEVPTNPDGMAPWADDPTWTFTAGDACDPQVAAQQPAEVDILFIDAGHLYAETKAELDLYMPRLVLGGTALLHDTRLDWDDFGVRRALDFYCGLHDLTWCDLPGTCGLGVLTLNAKSRGDRAPGELVARPQRAPGVPAPVGNGTPPGPGKPAHLTTGGVRAVPGAVSGAARP